MKRALLFVLILANFGAFAWIHWYVLPGRAQPAPAAAPGGQPLQLMSELTPAQRRALGGVPAVPAPAPVTSLALAAATHPAAVITPPAATGPVLACASYGPFPDKDAATQAVARLKAAGASASPHLIAGRAKFGYWVFLPPFGSRKEADAAAALLKHKGVTDIYVVPDEANRNAVSLGVFSQKEGAIQRERQIKKLGFRSQIAERFRDEPRYWIDAKGPAAALPPAEAMKDLGEEGSPVGRATSACLEG